MTASRAEASVLTRLPAEPRTAYIDENGPWRRNDLFRCLRGALIGGIGLTVCWYGASGETLWTDELPWVCGAVAAMAVLGSAAIGWLLVGLRSVRQSRAEVMAVLATRIPTPVLVAGTSAVVTGPGMTRFHRPVCAMASGDGLERLSSADAEALGLTPCGVCTP